MLDFWLENQKLCKKEYENQETVLKSYPVDMSIPFITYCDARCIFCSYWKFKSKKYMSFKELYKYKEIFKYLGYVGINPAGEPLLHPHFEKMIFTIRKMVDDRCGFYLVTNGFNVDKKKSAILDNINTLTISLNAATKRTHEIVMGVKDKFKKVIKNIEEIVNEKSRKKLKFEVYLAYVVLRQNIQEIPEFLDLAHNLGVDRVFLRTLATANDNNPIKPSLIPNYLSLYPKNDKLFNKVKYKAIQSIKESKIKIDVDLENWEQDIKTEEIFGKISAPRFREVSTLGEQLQELPVKGWVDAKKYGLSKPLRCQYLYKYMIDPRMSNIQPICVYIEVLPGFNPLALDLDKDFFKIRNAPAMVTLRQALKECEWVPETCIKCNILNAFKFSSITVTK